MPLHVLIERYLPLEYRKLLIPVAASGNKVFPCKWTCPSGSSGPCGWEDSLLAEAAWTLFCGTAPCEGFPQGTSGAINSWHSLELTQAVLWLSSQPAGSHQLLLQVIWRTWFFLLPLNTCTALINKICILCDANATLFRWAERLLHCGVQNVPNIRWGGSMLIILTSCLLKGEKLCTAFQKAADPCYSCVFF